MVADMAAPCVVGVDLGGTKLLAGALDENLNVHHRAQRATHELGQEELLDTVVAAVEEVRVAADSPMRAVGFGIPCTIDQTRGIAVVAVNMPAASFCPEATMHAPGTMSARTAVDVRLNVVLVVNVTVMSPLAPVRINVCPLICTS